MCRSKPRRAARIPAGHVLSARLISLLLGSCWMVAPALSAKNLPPPQAPAIARLDADTLLISIYQDMSANRLNDAQAKADALVQAYPNFHLGHLVRGDLLLMHTQSVTALGAASNATPERLKDLRDEAMVRLKSLSARPDPELVPRAVLQLRDDQKYALVVDARQSRLYVYQNLQGQLKLVTDYYITQGKLGVNKLKEGDQKTPVGIYDITSRVARAQLPDFYGAGALRINYPNDWDRLNGRGGSGIWLHGTPSHSYSRPPLASDGCVVLTNADLKELDLSIEIRKTPVIIIDHVEFVNKSKWTAERDAASSLIEGWRHDIESGDRLRVLKNYSGKFKSSLGEDLNTWFEKNNNSLVGVQNASVKVREVSLFRYPGREDLMVGTFTLETATGSRKSTIRKRQYWAKVGAQWKIVFENNA
jgi:murein L,D-transpeptidase YafK